MLDDLVQCMAPVAHGPWDGVQERLEVVRRAALLRYPPLGVLGL